MLSNHQLIILQVQKQKILNEQRAAPLKTILLSFVVFIGAVNSMPHHLTKFLDRIDRKLFLYFGWSMIFVENGQN